LISLSISASSVSQRLLNLLPKFPSSNRSQNRNRHPNLLPQSPLHHRRRRLSRHHNPLQSLPSLPHRQRRQPPLRRRLQHPNAAARQLISPLISASSVSQRLPNPLPEFPSSNRSQNRSRHPNLSPQSPLHHRRRRLSLHHNPPQSLPNLPRRLRRQPPLRRRLQHPNAAARQLISRSISVSSVSQRLLNLLPIFQSSNRSQNRSRHPNLSPRTPLHHRRRRLSRHRNPPQSLPSLPRRQRRQPPLRRRLQHPNAATRQLISPSISVSSVSQRLLNPLPKFQSSNRS